MMNYLKFVFGVLLSVSIVSGAIRYLAISVDDIDIIEVKPILQRITRQIKTDAPMMFFHKQSDVNQRSSTKIDKLRPILDYVDFGSQSSTNGAFSWFADYPAHH